MARNVDQESNASSLLNSLPTELLDNVMQYCWRKDLLNLRLVCQMIARVASRRLFADAYLKSAVDYSESFRKLVSKQEIAREIRRVHLVWNDRKMENRSVNIERAQRLFSCFTGLPQVSGIELDFRKVSTYKYARRIRWRRAPISPNRWQLVSDLLSQYHDASHNSTATKYLSICRLPNTYDSEIPESQYVKDLIRGLNSLSLFISTNHDSFGNAYLNPEFRQFVKQMPSIWLPSKTLTSLVLYFDIFIGCIPSIDWRETEFPCLRLLAMGKHSFSRQWQLDWLLSLKTLHELYLDDCAIIYAWTAEWLEKPTAQYFEDISPPGVYSGRWHHFFNQLNSTLLDLRIFRCGRGNWNGRRMFDEFREMDPGDLQLEYMVWDAGGFHEEFREIYGRTNVSLDEFDEIYGGSDDNPDKDDCDEHDCGHGIDDWFVASAGPNPFANIPGCQRPDCDAKDVAAYMKFMSRLGRSVWKA